MQTNTYNTRGFPGGSAGIKNPAMWETWVRSMGWEDALEKGTAVFWPGESHGLYIHGVTKSWT